MDRLTQLQQAVDKLLQVYFISIGSLQRDAPLMEPDDRIPVQGWTQEQINENLTINQALLVNSAKDVKQLGQSIDMLIDNLPGIDTTEEEQLNELERLRQEDCKCNLELQNCIADAGNQF